MLKLLKGVVLAALAAFVVQPAFADDARVRVIAKASVNVGSLADGAGETVTVTAPGVALGDACVASFGVDVVDMTVTCYVQAANAIEVRVQNESGSTADLASTTLRVFIFSKGTR